MLRRILCILLAVTALLGLLPVAAMASDEATESDNPPYAKIEYDYTPEVRCGTIRFINQMTSGELFRSDYWQEWAWKEISGIYYGPSSECGTSCMSMALSYIGINKTPNDILDYGGGYTYFKDWDGATISKMPVSEFDTAMDNYINGNGRYSPPVIHLPNYSNRGHFVVVIGKIDDDTYEILDPNNRAVTSMTITGSSAKYDKYGYTVYDRIDSLCQWFNPEAGPAVVKSVYPSSCTVKTAEEVQVMSLPCTAEKNSESRALQVLETDRELHTLELILNEWEEYWYKIEMPDADACYVPAGKVMYQSNDPAQLTISNAASPEVLEAGDYFALRGKISATNSRLTGVTVSVRKGYGTEGEVVTSGSAELSSSAYELSGSSIDSQVRFGKLVAGEYTYIIEAQCTNYYIRGSSLKSHEETVTLLKARFIVEAPQDREPPGQPVLQVNVETEQVTFSWERVAHTTHYHLLLQKQNADGEWEELEYIQYLPGSIAKALEIGTYRAQLIAYNENAWDDESDDWKHTPSEAVEFSVVCEHIYADGVVVQEATCREAGILRYDCTLCGESREEAIAQLMTHTPGPAATATEDQVCLVCGAILQKATGMTEQTEQPEIIMPVPEPTEPVDQMQQEDAPDIGAIVALIVLSGIGVCAVIFEKKFAVKKPREISKTEETEAIEETAATEETEAIEEKEETKEMQETQS